MQTMKKGGNHSSCECVPWMLGASGFLHLCLLFSKKFCWSGGELWVKSVAEKWWGAIFTLNLSLSGKPVPSLTDTINFKLYLHYQVYVCGDFFSLLRLNLDPEKGVMSTYPEFKPAAANRPPFIHFKWRAELIKKIPWWHK